jgi:hypothetical protein
LTDSRTPERTRFDWAEIEIHICPQDFSKEKVLLHLNINAVKQNYPLYLSVIRLFISNTSCHIEKRGATKPVKACWLTPQMARQSRAGFLVLLGFSIWELSGCRKTYPLR